MESSVPDSVRLPYERMQEAMIPLVQQHIVAIAAFYDGEMRQHATGTLVRVSDHHFLITAAHAIEDFDNGKGCYSDLRLFVDNGSSQDLVPLYGNYHATQTVRDRERPQLRLEGERDDLWDIGLWELHPRTIDALTNKRFLNRQNISVTDDLTTGVYFLAGCPCHWSQADTATQSMTWKWLRFITHPYAELDQIPNFDKRFHLALCWGADLRFPTELVGISGCPIWKLADLPVNDNWDVNQAKVVAIQTGVYRDGHRKAIRGTKWRYVLPVLAGMHPGIREAFKLWLPGTE